MNNRVSRRVLAGLAAVTPVALIGTARAETGESTFERVTRTKTLRIAALPGELPYFNKDITSGEWSGAAIDMARDIARVWDAKLAYVESTYGNSVLDLQSNKVDLAFALNPTPQRALSIGFTHPMIIHPFGCVARKGFDPKTWADADILAAMLGITALAKNPGLGTYRLLSNPTVALPSNLGVQREPDTRFVEVINAWLDMARGTGQIREWMVTNIIKFGARPEDIPAELSF
jgi:polar amino acid transport system substrate-binding protein